MNKKDRIAVVASIVLIPIIALVLVPLIFSRTDSAVFQVLLLVGVLIYWAYRFIKNDISFLKMKDD